jgi:hypothetical protein
MQDFNISRTQDVNFYLKKGDTFYFDFQVQYNDVGVDLSAYTSAKMQVRETELSSAVLTYSSSGGTINIENLAAGQIIINGSTASIQSNHYYYDLELRNDATVETVISGKFILEHDYTY